MIVSRLARGVYYLRVTCPDCGEFYGHTEGCEGCLARRRRYSDPHHRFLQAVAEPVYSWRPFMADMLGISREDPRLVPATMALARRDKLVVYLGRCGEIEGVGLPRQSKSRRKKLGRRRNVLETLIALGPIKASALSDYMHLRMGFVMEALADLYRLRLVEVERVSPEKLGCWSPRTKAVAS